ncbi:hypothetical protein LTR53_008105 [Teratosphaeriaceae sp. CCFEE 6253]|nr:hypothetical protein LTR53_008105 [Teratosphaeriaceae sp. CCFEE 6253]
MLIEPIMRDRVARKNKYDSRSIARDVLLATGRHPDMRALNAHLNHMAKLLGDHGGHFEVDGMRGNRSDLSTIRWDIIDPAEPVKAKLPAVAAEETADADDEDDELAHGQALSSSMRDNGDGTMTYVSVQDQLSGGKPKQRRRKRRTMPAPETATLANGNGDNRRVTVAGTTEAPAQGSPTVGYSAFRQVNADGVKKKGRPFGWRKSVHSRAAMGLPPAKSHHTPQPSGLRKAPGEKALVEPEYQVWKCRWRECGAELHNLDTLKKHVVKLHGRAGEDRQFECLWEGCRGGGEAGKGKGKARVEEEEGVAMFPDLTRWLAHVNELHLQPVAWELGDGPRGGLSDYNQNTDSEAYLSDAQGRSMTPVIRSASSGNATSRVLPTALRRADGMNKDERKAAAELAELEEHKKAVGPTMEKTGASWAIAKRKAGFLDDEDFEDEVRSEGEAWVDPDGEEDEKGQGEAGGGGA